MFGIFNQETIFNLLLKSDHIYLLSYLQLEKIWSEVCKLLHVNENKQTEQLRDYMEVKHSHTYFLIAFGSVSASHCDDGVKTCQLPGWSWNVCHCCFPSQGVFTAPSQSLWPLAFYSLLFWGWHRPIYLFASLSGFVCWVSGRPADSGAQITLFL